VPAGPDLQTVLPGVEARAKEADAKETPPATVDHISHGQLIFGGGRSGFPRAYEAYGISYGECPNEQYRDKPSSSSGRLW
jgi:hypothetical protein